MFSYKRFAFICMERGTHPSSVAAAIGFSNAAATGWKNGKIPRTETQEKMAQVLHCSVSDFDEKEKPTTENGSELSEDERDLISLFGLLSPDQQRFVIAQLQGLSQQKSTQDQHE